MMLSETPEGRQLLRELAKPLIGEIAPEELPIFDQLAEAYFEDPTPPALSAGKDRPLGADLPEYVIAFVPIVLAAINTVIGIVQVRNQLKQPGTGQQVRQYILELTPAEIWNAVYEIAIVWGMLPEAAKMFADNIVGALFRHNQGPRDGNE